MNQPAKDRSKKPHITVINRNMRSEIENVNSRLAFIERLLQDYNLRDVLMSINKPRRLIWLNFIAGVSRGLGLTIGTAIVLAILFFIMQHIVSLPIIGEYIADLINFVEQYRGETYLY